MNLTPKVLYEILIKKFGQQNWWPKDKIYHQKNNSDPRFEIIIGAILTQNTAWSNVEKALDNLKDKKLLEVKKITDLNPKVLQEMIKPSGYFNQKTERLKNIAAYLNTNYKGNLDEFFNRDLKEVRKELLSLNGIGPETADSILLYAGNKPVFVVDAYTKRICQRIPFKTKISYDEIQQYFQKNLCKSYPEKEIIQVYNELHALIVELAKNFCKTKPECTNCPLQKQCMFTKNLP